MKAVFTAYWPSVCKYRLLLTAMAFFAIITVLTKAVQPFLLRNLVEALQFDSYENVMLVVWIIVGALIANSFSWLLYDPLIAIFEARVMRDLDQRSFNLIQSQSMRFFENSFAGSLVTSAKRFRNSLEALADVISYKLGRTLILIVITLAVFAWEYPLLALAFGIWIVIFSTISILLAWLRVKRDAVVAKKDSEVGGAFADSFSNQATVKSFGKERDEQERFDEVTEDCYQHRKNAWLYGIILMRLQSIISAAFEAFVIFMMVRGWYAGTISAADIVFFQTYVLMLMTHVWEIGGETHKIFRNLADAKEMAEIYAQKPEVQDAPNARPLNVEEGEIEFHAVNFSYIDRETRESHDVNDFTLHVSKGQSVALVGHSGAGKSTLVKLLLRYFDLNSGYIRIDRQDVANVTQISLRQQIAVVPQQPDLFHRSLRDNIAFARPDASEEEIIIAAKRAHAWEFIQNLPEQDKKKGLDIVVGERGVKLSGGERQRIALARAFLADAPILILDEATSALDSKTEHQIQSAIADLLEGRTCIVIAHRLSTIQRADRIIVVEKGSIVEGGTHSELLDQSGVYADLWAHQSGGYINE
ncbi:MAG: ABC transporter ATP-binding protein [Candidatus Taylorbacteria bacterium]|nr:ABC transporter ATP-binding protein [Candidatus Taylorbacteria bacterium]